MERAMKTILLATDLSANSDRALERSLKIAKELNCTLRILHVTIDDENKAENTDKINNYLKAYKDADDLNIVIDIIHSNKPYKTIPEFATEVKADLIIIGLHGHTNIRDLFLGTTVERVLINSTTPILMVKDKPISSYKRILCGIDFAPASKRAFRTATKIAPNASFKIIHTYKNSPIYPNPQFINIMGKYVLSEEERKKAMADFIKEETDLFWKNSDGKTIKLNYEFLKSDPYYAIIQETEKRNIDLIAIGAYAEPSEKIGAVADSLMADPPCDILVSGEIHDPCN